MWCLFFVKIEASVLGELDAIRNQKGAGKAAVGRAFLGSSPANNLDL